MRVGYLRTPVRDLCNKVQSATVMRTSPAAIVGVNQGGIDQPKIAYLSVCLQSPREARRGLVS